MNNSKASRAVFELAAAQLQQEGYKFGVDVNIQITDAPTSTEDGFHIPKETMERFGLKTRPRGSFVADYPDNLYADEVRHPQPAGSKFSEASRKLKEADDAARAARAAYDEAAREDEARTEMFHAAAGSDPRIAKNTPAWFNSVEGREEVFAINPMYDVEISVRPVIGGAPASLRYAVLMAKTSGFVVEFQNQNDWEVTNVPVKEWQRQLVETGQLPDGPTLFVVADYVRYNESVPEGERLVSTDRRAGQFGRVHFDLLKTGTVTFIPRRYSHPRSFGVLSPLNKGRLGVQINFHGLDVPSSEVVRYMEAASMAVQTGFKVEVTEHKLNLTNHELIIPRGEEGNLRDYILIHNEGKWLHPDAITSIYNATVAPIPFHNPRLQPARAYGESELRDSVLFDQGQRTSYLDPDKAAFILDQVKSFGPRGVGAIDASLFRQPIARGYMAGVRKLHEQMVKGSEGKGEVNPSAPETALSRLFIAICQKQGIDKAALTSRVSDYIQHRYPSLKEFLVARSNLLKELQHDTMTWKTFCKGLEAIGMNAFTLSAGVSQVHVDLAAPYVVPVAEHSKSFMGIRKHVHDSRTGFSQSPVSQPVSPQYQHEFDVATIVKQYLTDDNFMDDQGNTIWCSLLEQVMKEGKVSADELHVRMLKFFIDNEDNAVLRNERYVTMIAESSNETMKFATFALFLHILGMKHPMLTVMGSMDVDGMDDMVAGRVEIDIPSDDGEDELPAGSGSSGVLPKEKLITTGQDASGPGSSEEGFLKAEGAVVIDWPEGTDEEQRALITNAVLVAHDRDRQVVLNDDGSILVPGSFSGSPKPTLAGATNLWQFVIFAGGVGEGPLQRVTPDQQRALNCAQVRFDLTPEEQELALAVKRRGTVIDADEEFTMREAAHPVVDSAVGKVVFGNLPTISAEAVIILGRGIDAALRSGHLIMIDRLGATWAVTAVDLETRLNTVLHQAQYPREAGKHYVEDFISFNGTAEWLGSEEIVDQVLRTEVMIKRKEEAAVVENTGSGDNVQPSTDTIRANVLYQAALPYGVISTVRDAVTLAKTSGKLVHVVGEGDFHVTDISLDQRERVTSQLYGGSEGIARVRNFIEFGESTAWVQRDEPEIEALLASEVLFVPVSPRREFVAEPDGDVGHDPISVFLPLEDGATGNAPYDAKVSADKPVLTLDNRVIDVPKPIEFALRMAHAEGRHVNIVSPVRAVVTHAKVNLMKDGAMYGSDYITFEPNLQGAFGDFQIDDAYNAVVTFMTEPQ